MEVAAGAVQQPGDILAVSRIEAAASVGSGEHMGQQRSPGRPGGRVVPRIGGYRSAQQTQDDPARLVRVWAAVWAVAQDGLHQPVQLQMVGADAGQRPLTEQPHQPRESQRVGGCGGQRLGQPVGMRGEQSQRNRLGRQPRGQAQQIQPRRVITSQPVEGHLPAGGQRGRIPHRPALGEHLGSTAGQQLQVLPRSGAGLRHKRARLLHRQGQILQRLRNPLRLRLGQPRNPRSQQTDRLHPLEHIHHDRTGQLVPVRVARGDQHMPPAAGKTLRHDRRVFSVVENQQPALPATQGAQQPRHRSAGRVGHLGEIQATGQSGQPIRDERG